MTLVPTVAVMLDGLVRIVAFIAGSGGNCSKDDEFEGLATWSGRLESAGENQIVVNEMMHIEARIRVFSLGFILFTRIMVFFAIGISNFPFTNSFFIY